MKTGFVIQTTGKPWRWATCRQPGLPSLTDNPQLRYTYDEKEQAEVQRIRFQRALNVPLQVRAITE